MTEQLQQEATEPAIRKITQEQATEFFKTPGADVAKVREGLGIAALGENAYGVVGKDDPEEKPHYVNLSTADFGTRIEDHAVEGSGLPPAEEGLAKSQDLNAEDSEA